MIGWKHVLRLVTKEIFRNLPRPSNIRTSIFLRCVYTFLGKFDLSEYSIIAAGLWLTLKVNAFDEEIACTATYLAYIFNQYQSDEYITAGRIIRYEELMMPHITSLGICNDLSLRGYLLEAVRKTKISTPKDKKRSRTF